MDQVAPAATQRGGAVSPRGAVLGVAGGLAGVLATAVGVGLVVARVQVAGYGASGPAQVANRLLTWDTAASVAITAAGLGLLAASTRAAWRSAGPLHHRHLARAAGLAGLLSCLVLLGIPTGAAAAAVLPPRGRSSGPSPAAKGLAGSEVRFYTSDRVRLAAWWVPGTNRAAVILVPGTYGTRSGVVDQAVVLARHGYGVLLLDPRGNGSSGGRGMGLGWFLECDLDAAVTFALAQPRVDPGHLAVLGESLGGEGALGAAARDPRIRAVVAEGATGRTASDDWSAAPGPLRLLAEAGRHLVDAEVGLVSAAPKPVPLVRAVTTAGCPVLLLSAGTQPAELRTARRAAQQARPPGRVVVHVIPGAAHADGLAADPAGWERAVTGFLDRALT